MLPECEWCDISQKLLFYTVTAMVSFKLAIGMFLLDLCHEIYLSGPD